jgi:hypothetical protein
LLKKERGDARNDTGFVASYDSDAGKLFHVKTLNYERLNRCIDEPFRRNGPTVYVLLIERNFFSLWLLV